MERANFGGVEVGAVEGDGVGGAVAATGEVGEGGVCEEGVDGGEGRRGLAGFGLPVEEVEVGEDVFGGEEPADGEFAAAGGLADREDGGGFEIRGFHWISR